MIWSYISHNVKGPLIFIDGGIDAQLYKGILQRYVLPHCLEELELNGVPHTFMDDGASCHDSNLVIEYCARVGIERPYWLPNSPDMNPIEWMWGDIKRQLSNLAVKPKSLNELKEILTTIWDQNYIRKQFSTMRKRVQ